MVLHAGQLRYHVSWRRVEGLCVTDLRRGGEEGDRVWGEHAPRGRTAERGVRGWRKSAMWGWGVWVGGVKIGKGAGTGRGLWFPPRDG